MGFMEIFDSKILKFKLLGLVVYLEMRIFKEKNQKNLFFYIFEIKTFFINHNLKLLENVIFAV